MRPRSVVLLSVLTVAASLAAGCGEQDASSSISSSAGKDGSSAECSRSTDTAVAFATLAEYEKAAGSSVIELPELDQLGMGEGVKFVAGVAGTEWNGECDEARTVTAPFKVTDASVKGMVLKVSCEDKGTIQLAVSAPTAGGPASAAELDDIECPMDGSPATIMNYAGVGPGDGQISVDFGKDSPANFVLFLVTRPD